MRRRAFTVPELLAVVAIISIILAILLPTFASARHSAYQALCSNNNRQIIQASLAYSVEHAQWMPFANWITQEVNGYKSPGWLYTFPNNSAPNGHRTGVLWPLLKEDSIYRCPMDAPPYIASSTHQFTSYDVNGAYCGYGYNPTFHYKRFRFAPNSIMLWEVSEKGGWISFNDGASYPSEPITDRHQTGVTVGCHDGHTEWMTYKDLIAEEAKKPGRLWCKPGSVNGL